MIYRFLNVLGVAICAVICAAVIPYQCWIGQIGSASGIAGVSAFGAYGLLGALLYNKSERLEVQ